MIIERIRAWAGERPHRAALVHNREPLTYAQLARRIESTTGFLAAQRLTSGSTAAVLTHDIRNAWLMVMGARANGLTTVVVSALAGAENLRLKGVSVVLVAEGEAGLAQSGPPIPDARLVVVPGAALRGETLEGEADFRAAPTSAPLGDHILYTSGTTGAYKKLLFDAGLEEARARERARLMNFDTATVFHALDFGLWTGVGFRTSLAVWLTGGCVVIDQTPEKFANFTRCGATYAKTLPESLRAIVATADPESTPSDTLLLECSGGFTPLEVAERAVARISRQVVIDFSATEICASIMKSEFRRPDDLHWLRPVDDRVVEVVDDDGRPCPSGVEGVLRIGLTDLDSHAYLDDPAATERVFHDGYFYPGDLAVRRDDGRVRILGRAGDVINIKGQKRPVAPIEDRLRQGLGVQEVCLFLGLAGDGVEELVVAVRNATPLDSAEVTRRLGESAIFDRVRVEVFRDFPRTHSGKTRRVELRRLVFGEGVA